MSVELAEMCGMLEFRTQMQTSGGKPSKQKMHLFGG